MKQYRSVILLFKKDLDQEGLTDEGMFELFCFLFIYLCLPVRFLY